MVEPRKFIVGTSGYSFEDWVGPFYPPGTKARGMFDHYVKAFTTTELNFTFYAMPFPRTLEALARKSPPGFDFWVKANQEITHRGNLTIAQEFIDDLSPLRQADKLAGVLLQFPQSFHRTSDTRRYLAQALEAFKALPLAVEFRHGSWDAPETVAGLRVHNVALVVPDEPELPGLYHPPPVATSNVAYLRLHSRDKSKWYGQTGDRYDYSYSEQELRDVQAKWSQLDQPVDKVYAMFNNCHRGQAAQNAVTFRRILEQIQE